MGKIRNLQPWLDYFEMLQMYEYKGYIELSKERNEAYITEAALMTLINADLHQSADLYSERLCRLRAYSDVVRRIRAYMAWKLRRGYDFIKESFALHIVKSDVPHDLKATLLITRRRRWWWPFVKMEHFDVITY